MRSGIAVAVEAFDCIAEQIAPRRAFGLIGKEANDNLAQDHAEGQLHTVLPVAAVLFVIHPTSSRARLPESTA